MADGRTGPIARAVMEANDMDLISEEEGMEYVIACGELWADDAYMKEALNYTAWSGHNEAVEAEVRIKDRWGEPFCWKCGSAEHRGNQCARARIDP